MGRYNGIFFYDSPISRQERDEATGFYNGSVATIPNMIEGGDCQLEKSIPAKQVIGTDGQVFTYSYTVFLPKHSFKGELEIGTKVQVQTEYGTVEEFTIIGIDNLNRRYIEVWG